MKTSWKLVLVCSLLVTHGCTDATSPQPELAIPATIVIPALAHPNVVSASQANALVRFGLVPVAATRDNEDVPPEYLQTSPLTAFTSVDLSGGEISGYAEMSFYGTDANQTMTLASWKDGATVGSQSFAGALSWLVPMGWSLGTNGVIPAPSCGAVATGTSIHTSKIQYLGRDISSQTFTSQATPRYQSSCPDTTRTYADASGSGGGGDDGSTGGYILYICTTTAYYSASGEYLGSSRSCRTETVNAT